MVIDPISQQQIAAPASLSALGDTGSASERKGLDGNDSEMGHPEQAVPQAQKKPETEFRLSGSPEPSPRPTQEAATVSAEGQPTKLISPEEFRKHHEAPFLGLLPKDFDRWAGLTEEARTREWADTWQKDQFAALGVIAPVIIGARHMNDFFQVYRPMVQKLRDELCINGRPSKDPTQRTWRSIGIDFDGAIGWESACKVIWNTSAQYVNRCLREGGRAAHQRTGGKPTGGGAGKHRGRKGDPKGSRASTAPTIQTPRALMEAIDRNETFKDALENVFMVDSQADYVRRVQEFAQLLADNFRPRGYRVEVKVQIEKESKVNGRPVPSASEDAQGMGPIPPAGDDIRTGALPTQDPKTSTKARTAESIPGPGAQPQIVKVGGHRQGPFVQNAQGKYEYEPEKEMREAFDNKGAAVSRCEGLNARPVANIGGSSLGPQQAKVTACPPGVNHAGGGREHETLDAANVQGAGRVAAGTGDAPAKKGSEEYKLRKSRQQREYYQRKKKKTEAQADTPSAGGAALATNNPAGEAPAALPAGSISAPDISPESASHAAA